MNIHIQDQPGGQSQTIMAQPPAVVSTKDFLYIEDILSWNLNVIKKAHAFMSVCQDAEVKQAMSKTCALHMKHYQALLGHLEKHIKGNTNPVSGGMQQ